MLCIPIVDPNESCVWLLCYCVQVHVTCFLNSLLLPGFTFVLLSTASLVHKPLMGLLENSVLQVH